MILARNAECAEFVCDRPMTSQDLKRIDELLYNPFSARISDIFSEDGSGRMSFKNFLEMFSVFSPRASFDIKVIFLFAMWDFDGETSIEQPNFSFEHHHESNCP